MHSVSFTFITSFILLKCIHLPELERDLRTHPIGLLWILSPASHLSEIINEVTQRGLSQNWVIDWSVNQWTNHSIRQSIGQLDNQSINDKFRTTHSYTVGWSVNHVTCICGTPLSWKSRKIWSKVFTAYHMPGRSLAVKTTCLVTINRLNSMY